MGAIITVILAFVFGVYMGALITALFIANGDDK